MLPGEDAWEDVVDPAFNQVIGFGMTTVEIMGFIQCGEYGMPVMDLLYLRLSNLSHLLVPSLQT
jgi:hypothetical protein